MRIPQHPLFLRLMTISAVSLLLCVSQPRAEDPEVAALQQIIVSLEKSLDARIGVMILDGGTEWQWGHRQDERFLMASTFKSVLCGAVLDHVTHTSATLEDTLPVIATDILNYAPVTRRHIGQSMTVGNLCFATLDQSDNTAANLLIGWIGGSFRVKVFLRSLGDTVTRLDRIEPELNRFVPNDPRDTTSPAAMVATWKKMLMGAGLTKAAAGQLTTWMQAGGVTGKLIRAHAPANWMIAEILLKKSVFRLV
ncbi:MAG: class A beta-lactamase [Sulfitobacter sp.]